MAEDERRPSGEVRGAAAAEVLALGAASRAKAEAYLDEQTRLARLQSEELVREDKLRHWSLRVRHISDVLKLGFELAAAFIVLAIAIGLGDAIWSASNADGLVIEAFAVPPPMAQAGLTGQVVASKLLDRLSIMQSATNSARAASTFANDWTNDIKVEIPDTGVSLGELVRYLHGALGHEMHLAGEVYQTPKGLALTVRLDGEPGRTFDGKPDELDAILQQAAEAIFKRAQPYRYGIYLNQHGREPESVDMLIQLAATGSPTDREWATMDLGFNAAYLDRNEEAEAYARRAIAMDPGFPNPYGVLFTAAENLGHDQDVLADSSRFIAMMRAGGSREWVRGEIEAAILFDSVAIDERLGDYRKAIADANLIPLSFGGAGFVATQTAQEAAYDHDDALSRARLSTLDFRRNPPPPGDTSAADAEYDRAMQALDVSDWTSAIQHLELTDKLAYAVAASSKGTYNAAPYHRVQTAPWLAYAHAMLGEDAVAATILKDLPGDCYLCTRIRGDIAAHGRRWGAAAFWFADAAKQGPSLPFAYSGWGRMLLAKGDYDGAIAKFKLANAKGPHFADPLEMWGEALMTENRSDLALPKFEEADKYAPNWGRLHLKWGEALAYSGDDGDAGKQFAAASNLDLSAADRAELARQRAKRG